MGKVVLLTGVPAVGKTTLARKVESTLFPIHRITFGELLFEIKRRAKPDATYEGMRNAPTKEASVSLVEMARSMLIERISQLRTSTNVLIDSHAVVKDDYGFRITPHSSTILQHLCLDAILILHAKHEVVANRINQDAAGRRCVSPGEIATHEALQDAVSIAYSISTGCPVFVIVANQSLEATFERVLKIFDVIGMVYSKVEE